MISPPMRSPRETVCGLYYFARMIDKIRLHLRGQLPDEYKPNFGLQNGLDGLLAQFLNLSHNEIIDRVRDRGTDEEILEWCFSKGLRPNETQIRIWNSFAEKIDWRDRAAATVERVKKQMGRADIATIFDCIDANEGRLNLTNS
jgi:gluconokinase